MKHILGLFLLSIIVFTNASFAKPKTKTKPPTKLQSNAEQQEQCKAAKSDLDFATKVNAEALASVRSCYEKRNSSKGGAADCKKEQEAYDKALKNESHLKGEYYTRNHCEG